jgi:hypothetical protein
VAAGDCQPHSFPQWQAIANRFKDFSLPSLRRGAPQFRAVPIKHGLNEAHRVAAALDQLVGNLC